MASTITTSVVTGGTNSHATSSAEVNAVATDFFAQGVVGSITNTSGVAPNTGSFAVNAQGTPAMLVDVKAGSAWITATPSGQTSQLLRATMTADYTSYAISSNSSGSTKYDWIYLKVDATAANNPASDASDVTALYTSRSSSNTTDNGTPPTYGILLAVVTVANGASSITNGNIADSRAVALPSTSSLGWTYSSNTWTYSSYDSTNKTGVITVPTDATLRHSAGQKVRFVNNGSLQYGIITKVASTALTVYLGTDYSLTSGAISQPAYSYHKAPFGFPLDPAKWTVSFTYTSATLPTNNGSYQQQGSLQITYPIGVWRASHQGCLEVLKASSTDIGIDAALSSSISSVSDNELQVHLESLGASGTIGNLISFYAEKTLSFTTATTYYTIVKANSGITGGIRGDAATYISKGVCAYL